jgi:hypothetical protein
MDTPRSWRTRRQRYALVGEVCEACGSRLFPPRDVCPACAAPAKTPYTFSGRGEVYSYATVYHAPAGFEEFAPYVVALVRLAEGPLIAAQLADVEPGAVAVGMPVEMVTRRLRDDGPQGVVVYGYKFRPRLEVAGAAE